MRLEELLMEDEKIVEYGVTSSYCTYQAIIMQGSDDISAALENTLHRILQNGGNEDDVQSIMGAFIPTSDTEVNEDECVPVDLCYVIDGLITFWQDQVKTQQASN